MRLVEGVRGDKTSKPVIATSMQLARRLGKIAALVSVGPGSVGNRMLAQRQREAHQLVLEGALPYPVRIPGLPFRIDGAAGKRRQSSRTGRAYLRGLAELARYSDA